MQLRPMRVKNVSKSCTFSLVLVDVLVLHVIGVEEKYLASKGIKLGVMFCGVAVIFLNVGLATVLKELNLNMVLRYRSDRSYDGMDLKNFLIKKNH